MGPPAVPSGRTAVTLAALFILISCPVTSRADDGIPADRETQLRQAYYNDRVLETCGLYTAEVYDGFQRRVTYLIVTSGIDDEARKRIEIDGWSDADYQYGNHGMAGFRFWCASDGKRAAAEFLEFRRQQLVDQKR